MSLAVIVGIGFCIVLYVFLSDLKKNMHRKELVKEEFPDSFKKILETNLPLYKKLPDDLKKQLHGKVNVFLEEKPFEGCGGLEITDEIRVTIAGQASMLLLNREDEFFNVLTSVLVYPAAYIAKAPVHNNGSIVDSDSVRLGESWNSGTLVLSWNDVKYGIRNPTDGQNVIIHEFAHQLDQEDGSAHGDPILESPSNYVTWAKVLGEEFKVLKEKAAKHKKSTMDHYGATNPAEFFAVATETFFEKPEQMKQKHPDLYEELKKFYKLDPCSWE